MNSVFKKLFILILPVLLVAQNHREILPKDLGPLRLEKSLSGGEAQSLLDRLHERSVAPKLSLMGQYSSTSSSATLYVSVYDSTSHAAEALDRMTARIKAGNAVFRHYGEGRNRGLKVSRCTGLGQVHFLFRFRERLLWLAVDPSAASRTLDALADVVLNSVPGR